MTTREKTGEGDVTGCGKRRGGVDPEAVYGGAATPGPGSGHPVARAPAASSMFMLPGQCLHCWV